MRVLVFGDSITQGYWDTDGGWVSRIRKHYDEIRVQNLQEEDELAFFNLGISADSSTDVLARIVPETKTRIWLQELPVVIVQIGVNDSRIQGGQPFMSPEDYKRNLAAIIERVKPLSTKLIFIGSSGCDEAKTSPVAWDAEAYWSNERMQTFEAEMKSVAQEHNVPFIPVFDQFTAKFKQDNSILPDGLHPDNAGHQIIADIVLPQLKKLLA